MIKDMTRAARHDSKPEDRYQGPYVVIRRTRNGAYQLVAPHGQRDKIVSVGGRRVAKFTSREDLSNETREILHQHGPDPGGSDHEFEDEE